MIFYVKFWLRINQKGELKDNTTLFHCICGPLIIWFPAYWRLICLTWVYSDDKFEVRKLPIFIWSHFYLCIINEFHIVMHAKWRSAFQPENGLKGIWKNLKGGFKASLYICYHDILVFASHLFHFMQKNISFSLRPKLLENIFLIGDCQLSCSGFVEVIGAVA